MATAQMNRKVQECVTFLETTLRPDYRLACGKADAIRTEMDEYRKLQQQLVQQCLHNRQQQGGASNSATTTGDAKTIVDLGFGILSCEAVVVAPSNQDDGSIFVHVGMGFHVDLRHDEAQQAIQRRLQYLQGIWKTRQAAADVIKEHIVSTEQILDELSRLKKVAY